MVGAANESAAIAHKLNSWLAMTDNLIEQRLSLAKNAGEIVPDVDVLRLARVTNSLRHGLSIRARAGESREQLRQAASRSEEHTSELQSLMRISYAVFCLKKKKH